FAEPGPFLHAALAPGSAAHHFVLRRVRGTQAGAAAPPLTKRQYAQTVMVNPLLRVMVYFVCKWHRVRMSFRVALAGRTMIVRQFISWIRTAPAGERAEATRALARAWLISDLSEDDRAAAEGALFMLR